MCERDSHPLGIQTLLTGKCVLITGVTGFLGKVLLEKLVRSCHGISEILVLIRHNAKSTSSERLTNLLDSNVFDRIKLENPCALDKIRAIDGDVSSENLALSEKDLKRIYLEVNYVFHCAASVRFENDPKSTLRINFLGVKNMLNVCNKIAKLEAFVHVSTAYSFCNQPFIDEKIYSENIKVRDLEDSLQWMNDEQLKEFCKRISASRPSLYHYSKAMAEIYLSENCGKLPIIIVRPSIITAAAEEPFPGWIDNYNGPSGFIALSSKGLLKTLLVKSDINADWVPVDLVANTLIVAAYYIATETQHSSVVSKKLQCQSTIPVINCVCPSSNCITWYYVIETCIPLLYKYPSLQIYSPPGGVVTSSPVIYSMCKYFYHFLPASIFDILRLLIWKRTWFVNTYKRIHKVMSHLQLYMLQHFFFCSTNMNLLLEIVPSEDRKIFPINQSCLDWEEYLENYVHGVRKFYLKENDNTLSKAQCKLAILRVFYACGKVIPIGVLLMLYLQHVKKTTLLSTLKTLRFHSFTWNFKA